MAGASTIPSVFHGGRYHSFTRLVSSPLLVNGAPGLGGAAYGFDPSTRRPGHDFQLDVAQPPRKHRRAVGGRHTCDSTVAESVSRH